MADGAGKAQQVLDLAQQRRDRGSAGLHFGLISSSRSVAGAGVRESAEISARSSGVISIFTESSDACSCSRLRAPMIGAVAAGGEPTQATAALIGCQPRFLQNSANAAATSCIHASP